MSNLRCVFSVPLEQVYFYLIIIYCVKWYTFLDMKEIFILIYMNKYRYINNIKYKGK